MIYSSGSVQPAAGKSLKDFSSVLIENIRLFRIARNTGYKIILFTFDSDFAQLYCLVTGLSYKTTLAHITFTRAFLFSEVLLL